MAETNQQGQNRIAVPSTIRGTKQQVVRAGGSAAGGDVVPIHPNQMQASLTSKEDARGKAAAAATLCQWARVKWTRDMVKLLVSTASYLDEDMDNIRGGRKVGKWRVISSAMAERGFPVSPQQCEDKFYDLNKRYKRVTEILGKGTACDVVEKPELLELMTLPEKLKEEARKHLSSKHLHYEEMCSYNNWNRVSLLDDPALRMMLRRLAGWGPDGPGMKCQFGHDEDDLMFTSDEDDDEVEEVTDVGEEGHRGSVSQVSAIGMNGLLSEGSGAIAANQNSSGMSAIQIERKRLKIKGKMLKIEKCRLKQLRAMQEEDMELKMMKLENDKMKLENDKLELELKLKEMEMGIKPKRI